MKICFINSLYKPYSRGGTEVVAEIIVQGLKDNGHEVFVITIKPFEGLSSFWPEKNNLKNISINKESISFFKEGEGDVYRFYPLNLFSFINIGRHNVLTRLFWHIFDVFNLHSYFIVKDILKREKPEVVITHNLKGIGYLVPWAIKNSGIKWLHIVHDVQLVEPSGIIIKGRNLSSPSLSREVYKRICRWLFDSPKVIISPSKWLLDFYRAHGFFPQSKKVVMSNPIKFPISNFQFPNKSQIQNSNFRFLYLGQIEKHKGVLFLIKVFRELLKYQISNTKYQLLIAGDGSKLEEIKKAVENEPRIRILGRLPHEKIADLFSQIDFTIVPSLCYENSPTVIYESFAAGVPVIAARIGGVAELVKDGINGFIFEAGNEEDLLRALKLAMVKRESFNKEEIKKTVEGFGLEKYIRKLIDLTFKIHFL